MHGNDIALYAFTVSTMVAGAVCGALRSIRWFEVMRRVAMMALAGFLITMIMAVIVARSGPESDDQLRLVIFWMGVLFAESCLFTFSFGAAGLFRKSVCRIAAMIAVLSILVAPILLAAAVISRAMSS